MSCTGKCRAVGLTDALKQGAGELPPVAVSPTIPGTRRLTPDPADARRSSMSCRRNRTKQKQPQLTQNVDAKQQVSERLLRLLVHRSERQYPVSAVSNSLVMMKIHTPE